MNESEITISLYEVAKDGITDVDDNGQPVPLRSLMFSRLYISLMLLYISS